MRNLLWLLLLSLFAFSCDEEDCNDTVADSISFSVSGEIMVINQAGLPIKDYPVRITFQKHWCDGSVGLAAEFTGQTNVNGEWFAAIQYTLLNEEDYITVHYQAGSGEQALGYFDEFKYGIIRATLRNSVGVAFHASHTFEIVQ